MKFKKSFDVNEIKKLSGLGHKSIIKAIKSDCLKSSKLKNN